jgi:uncharacterized repeat protein (TIGR03803 family)
MRDKRPSNGLKGALTILTITLLVANSWAAPGEKVLYSFSNSNDGANPSASLILDTFGNLYGTTRGGGDPDCLDGCGTVFELIHPASGKWKEKVLHRFSATDGANPYGGLIFGANGSLLGTTENSGGVSRAGTVFELTRRADGSWAEKILHRFKLNTSDGDWPQAGLTFDASGNLFGTTYGGGSLGTVFELTPKAGGGWAEKILHSFTNQGKDGYQPYADLVFDASGNLYGTTSAGGAYGSGAVFELTPKAGGGWTEKILHNFADNGKDGYPSYADLVFDASGNLYGTTSAGGAYGFGAVFELTPKAGGGWTEKILHNFNGKDGDGPIAGLIFDAAGNLYGTTVGGGGISSECKFGCGTVFELTPKAGGGWTEKILHSFNPSGMGGAFPFGSLIFDASGNLLGTTYGGGAYGYGTVFEITP